MNKTKLTHETSLVLTKLADGLIDPKLVLAWLLNAIGAPGYLIGVLVPVREAGSLLPQLFLASYIERHAYRKWIWAAGSALQGLAAIGMAIAALTLSGAAAGWVILVCLAVLAVARAACSASFKDILSRTVDKGQRGKVSGTAGTLAAALVFAFAILLSVNIWPRTAFAIFSHTIGTRSRYRRRHTAQRKRPDCTLVGRSRTASLYRDPRLVDFNGTRPSVSRCVG